MSKNIQEERLRWVLPVVGKELKLSAIAKVCPYSERSLKRWCAAYRKEGVAALIPKSTELKSQPNETPIRIKEEVVALRKKTGLCARKLHWRLKKQGLTLPVSTIGKILKQEGLVRKYRTKKMKCKYLRAERRPGELLEIDVKYVPGRVMGQRYFQYTAIDTASRWRHLAVYDEQTTHHSILFLEEVIGLFPHKILAVKTDNGSIFTNYYVGMTKRSDLTVKTIHALDRFCAERGIIHYLIDPGKPAQNGTVERSHREDEEKFYQRHSFKNFADLQKKLRSWNMYYNDLEHCGLNGKTPNEFLANYLITNPPNVCT
ncbi:MAG: transposase [Candidatus Niyogibacteria bacterium]|nr:transposase [Candidatus Niyogibacteria bacterium]